MRRASGPRRWPTISLGLAAFAATVLVGLQLLAIATPDGPADLQLVKPTPPHISLPPETDDADDGPAPAPTPTGPHTPPPTGPATPKATPTRTGTPPTMLAMLADDEPPPASPAATTATPSPTPTPQDGPIRSLLKDLRRPLGR